MILMTLTTIITIGHSVKKVLYKDALLQHTKYREKKTRLNVKYTRSKISIYK